jgi:hypothetical protein
MMAGENDSKNETNHKRRAAEQNDGVVCFHPTNE